MKRLLLYPLLWGAYSGALLRLLELCVYLRSSKAILLDHAIGAAGEIVASAVVYVALSAGIRAAGRAARRDWLGTPIEHALLATLQAVVVFLLWCGLRTDRITLVGTAQGPIALALGALLLSAGFAVGRRAGRRGSAIFLAAIPVAACLGAAAAEMRPLLPPDEAVAALAGRPNVLLLMVDTLRRDKVDFASEAGRTPNLARLARSGVVYDAALSASPWTGPATASILTGRYPSEHGVAEWSRTLPDEAVTAAEIFGAAGYRTAGLVSNSVLGRQFRFEQGYDSYHDARAVFPFGLFLEIAARFWKPRFESTSPLSVKRFFHRVSRFYSLADRTTKNATLLLGDLARGGRPFFFFLHYMDPHRPYRAPDRFFRGDPGYRGVVDGFEYMEYDPALGAMAIDGTPMTERDVSRFHELYDAEVRHADDAIGDVLDRMEELRLLENTWLVFVADHGEYFGEHRLSAHSRLYGEVLRVPLLVRPPGGLPAMRRVATVVETRRILPTLLAAADVPAPEGVPLPEPLPESGDEAPGTAFAEAEDRGHRFMVMVRRGDRKLIRDHAGSEFYDLRSDPGEEKNLYPAGLAERDAADGFALLDSLLGSFIRDASLPAPAAEETPAQEEALRALGYLE